MANKRSFHLLMMTNGKNMKSHQKIIVFNKIRFADTIKNQNRCFYHSMIVRFLPLIDIIQKYRDTSCVDTMFAKQNQTLKYIFHHFYVFIMALNKIM